MNTLNIVKRYSPRLAFKIVISSFSVLAWTLLLDCHVSAVSIRATTSPTFSSAIYWGHIGKWTGSTLNSSNSNLGFTLEASRSYPKHAFSAGISLTPAYPGSAAVVLKAEGNATIFDHTGTVSLQEGPNTRVQAVFDFTFVTNWNYGGNPILSIPATMRIPHWMEVDGYAPNSYANTSFLFILTKVSLLGKRTEMLNAQMKLESETMTQELVIQGVLSGDPAFVSDFETANHQAFNIDFEPNTKYQVQMIINGAAVVFGDNQNQSTASFYVEADPRFELADDGIPYDEAFYLQVSPGLMEPPDLATTSSGNDELTFDWLAPPGMYELESTQDLTTPDWQTVPATVISEDDSNSIRLLAPNTTTFYRLLEQQP